MLKSKFWSFLGKDEENKSIRGLIDAPNKTIAHYMLLKMVLKKVNYLIVTFTSYKKALRLNTKEKLQLISNISIQINAGLSIFDSIESIKIDSNSFKTKYLLFIVLKNMHEGYSFSRSLEKLAYNPFSKTETGLIKASEITGSLDITLKFICENLENKLLIQKKLTSALIYPAITLFVSFIVTFIIFKWVIPQFEIVFSQKNHTLPWITGCIFSISRHFNTIVITMIIFCLLCYTLLRILIKYSLFSKQIIEKCVLKTPIVAKAAILTNRINFCYTLSMLLSAGVSLNEALNESIEHITLPSYQERLNQAFNEILLGKKLSATLKKTQFFPRSTTQTIAIAENTGRLDHAFKSVGQQFSHELSVFFDHSGKMIEPFIIILLGGIIATIVIAIYLPIFQLGSLY